MQSNSLSLSQKGRKQGAGCAKCTLMYAKSMQWGAIAKGSVGVIGGDQ